MSPRWLDRVLRRRAAAQQPVVFDLNAAAQEIIDLHTAIYHPGTACVENEEGQCVDRFGGTPAGAAPSA
jgi:hypothetical protein